MLACIAIVCSGILVQSFLLTCAQNPGRLSDLEISDLDDDDTIAREYKQFNAVKGKKFKVVGQSPNALERFKETRKLIREHNKLGHKFQLGLNKYADTPMETLRKNLLGSRPPSEPVARISEIPERTKRSPRFAERVKRQTPNQLDYSEWGFTYAIEDQGQCGSCYTFTAAATLAAYQAMLTGQLTPLSEQNLLDCTGSYGNYGCNGGWPGSCFNYIKDKGIMLNSSYAYTGSQSTCKYNSALKYTSGTCITGVNYLTAGDEDAMLKALTTNGPLAVGINADAKAFIYYKSGIYVDNSCSKEVNHAITITGYGTADDGTKYWIIRNSWGDDWGENGYGKYARGNSNQCGIASWAHYPVLSTC